MFCNKCGKEITSNSQYCEECTASMVSNQQPKSKLEIEYETFKADANTIFSVSIVSLVLMICNFRLFDLATAIFCIVKYKKIIGDKDLYVNMPDYSKTLNNLHSANVMAKISLICSIVALLITVGFFIFYFLFMAGTFILPIIPILVQVFGG